MGSVVFSRCGVICGGFSREGFHVDSHRGFAREWGTLWCFTRGSFSCGGFNAPGCSRGGFHVGSIVFFGRGWKTLCFFSSWFQLGRFHRRLFQPRKGVSMWIRPYFSFSRGGAIRCGLFPSWFQHRRFQPRGAFHVGSAAFFCAGMGDAVVALPVGGGRRRGPPCDHREGYVLRRGGRGGGEHDFRAGSYLSAWICITPLFSYFAAYHSSEYII